MCAEWYYNLLRYLPPSILPTAHRSGLLTSINVMCQGPLMSFCFSNEQLSIVWHSSQPGLPESSTERIHLENFVCESPIDCHISLRVVPTRVKWLGVIILRLASHLIVPEPPRVTLNVELWLPSAYIQPPSVMMKASWDVIKLMKPT